MYSRKHLSGSSLRRLMCMLLALLTVGSLVLLPGVLPEAFAATSKVSIPSPADYFGDVDDTNRGGTSTAYIFEGYSAFPEAKIDSYIGELKKAGLSGGTVEKQSNGDMLASFTYNGKWIMAIRWRKKDQHVWMNISHTLNIKDSVSTTTTTTAKTTTSGNKPTIPSPGDYFGGVDETNSGNGSTAYSCYNHSTFPKSKVESYVSALKKAGLTGGKIEKQSDGDMLAQLNYKGEWAINIRWYAKKHYIWCNISDDLSVADEKKTTTTTTTKSNTTTTTTKPSTTTTKPTEPPKPTEDEPIPGETKQCSTCFGDGKCSSCNGKGYKMKWVSGTKREYVQQTCTTCFGMKKCYSCGGDGWKYK